MSRFTKKFIEMPNTIPNPENSKIPKILIQTEKEDDRMTHPSPNYLDIHSQIDSCPHAIDSA
jgi:hypothetical protein